MGAITINTEHHLKEAYEQEIGLKMLEMVISAWKACTYIWRSGVHPSLKILDLPLVWAVTKIF